MDGTPRNDVADVIADAGRHWGWVLAFQLRPVGRVAARTATAS